MSLSSERAALAFIIDYPESFREAIKMVSVDHFTSNSRKIIFELMDKLDSNDAIIEPIMLKSLIKKVSPIHSEDADKELNSILGYGYHPDNFKSYLYDINESFVKAKTEELAKELQYKLRSKAPSNELFKTIDEYGYLRTSKDKDAPESLISIAENESNSIQEAIDRGEEISPTVNLVNYPKISKYMSFRAGNVSYIAGRPAMGKAQTLTSKIVTPFGMKNMGDICIGDIISGSDGKPITVTGVFPQGIKDVWNVIFDDGTSVECCSEHLWTVQSRSDRKAAYGKYKNRVITTEEISKNIYVDGGTRKNYSIDYCSPIEFVEKKIYLDPYFLGLYLGDGYSYKNKIGFSNIEKDLISSFDNLLPGEAYLVQSSKNKKDCNYMVNKSIELRNILEDLGLLHKKSHEKFIPKCYLYNSIENRVKLLRGLIDTDGYVISSVYSKKTNNIEYTTTSKQLGEDVCNLVRGLGGKAVVNKRKGKYGSVICKDYYRININFADGIIPVSSKKHLAKYTQKKQFHKKFIVNVRKLNKKEEMQCISVSAKNNLYLTDNYTITHNTSVLEGFAYDFATQGYKVLLFSLEMSKNEILERYIQKELGIPSYDFRSLPQENRMNLINELKARFIKNSIDITIVDNQYEINEINATVKQYHKNNAVDIVLLDYLQLVELNGMVKASNANAVVSEISRMLTVMAGRLRLPIISLAQLSRAVEKRDDKVPILSDLRDSGSIEQDASSVAFLYRESYYNPNAEDKRTMFVIRKARFGKLGRIYLEYNESSNSLKESL